MCHTALVRHGALAPLVIVIGPTGSGKSELGLRIAERFRGEIVSCDSLQIYRHFNIGTAKLTSEARRGIPHHLIDIAEPSHLLTAADYSVRARAALGEIAGRGRLPIIVGGTGFYLKTLLEGLFPGPERNATVRIRLMNRENRRPGSLHPILGRLDPSSAARIHPNDVNKTIRALEVRLIEKKSLSELFTKGRDPLTGFQFIKIGLNPPQYELYRRLDVRAANMFGQGLLKEAREMLAAGIPVDAKPFECLGYRQALQVLQGDLTVDQAVLSTQIETRRYAKRQMTWFRREKDVRWLAGFGDEPALQEEVLVKVLQNMIG